jgi:hypothetical protein
MVGPKARGAIHTRRNGAAPERDDLSAVTRPQRLGACGHLVPAALELA